jgi:pimeloyl-ACP methyl ester carboxylesterase
LERIVLVGGSMGGVVAQHFVLRHPERVSRLLLVATGAYTADPQTALTKADAMEKGAWDETTVTSIVNGFFRKPPPASEVVRLRGIAMMTSKTAAIEAARSNAKSRTLERLCDIKVPTLIIQGRHDRARTPEHGAEMRDRIAGAHRDPEGPGHTPYLEEQSRRLHRLAMPFLPAAANFQQTSRGYPW